MREYKHFLIKADFTNDDDFPFPSEEVLSEEEIQYKKASEKFVENFNNSNQSNFDLNALLTNASLLSFR